MLSRSRDPLKAEVIVGVAIPILIGVVKYTLILAMKVVAATELLPEQLPTDGTLQLSGSVPMVMYDDAQTVCDDALMLKEHSKANKPKLFKVKIFM
jgi:hypothetical protein